MTRQSHDIPNGDDPADAGLDLPPRLLAALRAEAGRTPAVPSAVDAAIARQAAAYFARQRRVRLWTRGIGSAAAAAVVLIGLRLALFPGGGGGGGGPGPADLARAPAADPAGGRPLQAAVTFAPEDVNRDGTVDVLDAFAVARAVKAGRPLAAWDVTNDGVVDQRDVDAIAARAVSVAGGGGGRPVPAGTGGAR